MWCSLSSRRSIRRNIQKKWIIVNLINNRNTHFHFLCSLWSVCCGVRGCVERGTLISCCKKWLPPPRWDQTLFISKETVVPELQKYNKHSSEIIELDTIRAVQRAIPYLQETQTSFMWTVFSRAKERGRHVIARYHRSLLIIIILHPMRELNHSQNSDFC